MTEYLIIECRRSAADGYRAGATLYTRTIVRHYARRLLTQVMKSLIIVITRRKSIGETIKKRKVRDRDTGNCSKETFYAS